MPLTAYPPVRDLPPYLRDPNAFLTEAAARPGDVAELLIGRRTLLIKRPEDAGHVLSGNHRNYEKTPRLTGPRGRRVIGEGLFTRRNESALAHRRAIQPLFARRALAGLEDGIAARAAELTAGWRPGSTVDLLPRTERHAVAVSSDAILGPEALGACEEGMALRRRRHRRSLHGPVRLPAALPLAVLPGRRRALRGLESALAELIAARRAEPAPDLLSGLAAAGLGDERIRDEALSLSIAGINAVTQATAVALATVARHPGVVERIREEAESAGPDPRVRLAYTEQAVLEVLRLHPPTPTIVRVAQAADALPSGARVVRGAKLIVSPFVLHRDPSLYPDPERYDPDRFTVEARRARPRFAYIPFGAGPRACIGRNLAMLEIVVTVAHVLERFELEAAGRASVRVARRRGL